MAPLASSYNSLIKKLKEDTSGFSPLKVAVLADFSAQHLVKALQAAAVEQSVSLRVWEGDYDSIGTTVLNEASPFYSERFDYILIFQSSFKLYNQYSNSLSKATIAVQKLEFFASVVSVITHRTASKIICSNFVEIDDRVFGNFANKIEQSFLYQLRKINLDLMNLARAEKNLFIVDVQSLINFQGRENCIDSKLYIHADLIFNLDFLATIAQNTMQIISAVQGSFKKCIILDLDNTLWGGIIGDDGIENIEIGELGIGKAFTNLQIWLKNLKERGIILAVSSKNTEAIAKEVFEKHPGMILRLQDISVFSANWETKVDNILHIQSILNIGFDSIVFIDDNPFEREIVNNNIPGITVPDLPEDPAYYLEYLQSLNLFETASFSTEDSLRTERYQEEANRKVLEKNFTSEQEFLKSLEMVAIVKPVDAFTLPRVAQLTQRSNQFNLRTIRYTEEEISGIVNDPEKYTLTVTLRDKFGDYGLISAVILQKISEDTIFIDTWIMSCRVLKRGVENLLLGEIVNLAKKKGFSEITAEYIPTAKNGIVRDHYKHLGFKQINDNEWILEIPQFKSKNTYIKKTTTYALK